MCFFGQNKLNLERGKETLHFIFQGNVYHREGLMNSQTHQVFFFFFFFGYTFISGGPSFTQGSLWASSCTVKLLW